MSFLAYFDPRGAYMQELLNTASSQPIWVQVVIGLVVFFIVLPLAVTIPLLLLVQIGVAFDSTRANQKFSDSAAIDSAKSSTPSLSYRLGTVIGRLIHRVRRRTREP